MSELPKGWVTVKTTDLFDINPGHKELPVRDSLEVSFVPMTAIEEETGKLHPEQSRQYGQVKSGYTKFIEGDVVFAKITPCMENGKVAIAKNLTNGIGCGTTELHVFRPVLRETNQFLLHFLLQKSVREAAQQSFQGTSGHLRVPVDFFREIDFPLPPLNEQRRIVAKLENLLARVEASQQRLAKIPVILKRFRQSVLAAACSGRLTADWREENPTIKDAAALLKEIKDSRSKWLRAEIESGNSEAKRIKSKLHKHSYSPPDNIEIPESWAWASFLAACQMVVDCHNKTAPYVDKGIPLVRTTNVKFGKLYWEGMKYVSQKTYDFWSRRCPPETGDILFTREAPMGDCTVVPENTKLCLGQRMMLLRSDKDRLLPEFISYAIQDPLFQMRVDDNAVGSGVKHLRVGDVEGLIIPIAPLPEQQEIVRRVEALFKFADQIETRHQKAKAHVDRLTQSLLAKAFRGELVPQNENDEPASVLLERIQAERAKAEPKKSQRKATVRPIRKTYPTESEPPLAKAAEPAASYGDDSIPQQILAAMQPGREYSRADLAGPLKLSAALWNHGIRQLKEQGLVSQQGEKRGARYIRNS